MLSSVSRVWEANKKLAFVSQTLSLSVKELNLLLEIAY